MKGLILKDFINLKRNIKIMAALTVLYAFMSFAQEDATFFSTIFTMLFAILMINTYSLDEAAKWDSYALTMPILKDDIVKGKYLMMLLLTLIGSLFSAVILVLLNIIMKAEVIFRGIEVCAVGAAVVILFYSITLPFITKLGVEKARFVFFAVYLVPFFVAYMLKKQLSEGNISIPEKLLGLSTMIMDNIYVIAPLVLVVALGISYMISIKIYRKKEF
jgi:hypothetical protein